MQLTLGAGWGCLCVGTAFLLACSSSSGAGVTNTDAGPKDAAADTGSSAQDTGASDSGSAVVDSGSVTETGPGDGGSGDGSSPGGQPYTGDVTATVTGTSTTFTYGVVAEFSPTTTGPACPGTMMGSCCFEPAATAPPDAGAGQEAGAPGDGGASGPPNAGVIAVTDGSTTIATIMPSADPNTGGYAVPQSVGMWNAGDTLSVTAPGATIHAFTGSVPAVSVFAGVMPNPSSGPTISRSTELVVSWTTDTKTTGSNVQLAVADAVGNAVACQVPDAAGTVTVPIALLAMTASGAAVLSLQRTLATTAADSNATVAVQSAALVVGNASLE